MTEQEAIARLKGGDIGGLELLVKTYQRQATQTAYLITHDWASAEDMVQAAFLQAYERIDQFDSERRFGPWFLRSVVNRAVMYVTRSKRHISLETGNDGQSFAELLAAPDALDAAETHEAIWTALDELPPEQRAAVVMRYFLELSEDEIADALFCPPGTVKWRLHAARKRLGALLRPLWPTRSVLKVD